LVGGAAAETLESYAVEAMPKKKQKKVRRSQQRSDLASLSRLFKEPGLMGLWNSWRESTSPLFLQNRVEEANALLACIGETTKAEWASVRTNAKLTPWTEDIWDRWRLLDTHGLREKYELALALRTLLSSRLATIASASSGNVPDVV
jgi:hypothetical protein